MSIGNKMHTKKARAIKAVIQAVVVVGVGYLVRHKVAETHAPAWIAAGWLLTAWVVVRIGLAIKRAQATLRTHAEAGVSLATLDKVTVTSMPPWARGYYEMEKKAYRGAWHSLTGAPLLPAGEFSVVGGPNHARTAAVALALVCAAAVLGAIYLPHLATSFWPRAFWSAGAVVGGLYAAVWIVGDRRNLREGGHRIASGALILDLGLRCTGAVPLHQVAACSVIERGMAPLPADQVWTVSPGERPNVLIELTGVMALQVTLFGSARAISKRYITLYVDHPAAFADAVQCLALRRAAPGLCPGI